MGKTAWIVVGIVQIAIMVAMVVAAAVMGGCDTVLETTSGGTAYMKCYWLFKAVPFTAAIGIVSALLTVIGKDMQSRRFAAIMTLVCVAAVVIMTTNLGIGLCGGTTGMHCHQTAHVTWALAAISAILSVIQIAKADPSEADKPKMTI